MDLSLSRGERWSLAVEDRTVLLDMISGRSDLAPRKGRTCGIHPLTFKLIGLLTSRNGLGVLPGIVAEYERLLDLDLGRERAEVVTAVPLSKQQQNIVAQQLGQLLGKDVILASRVDDAVIGGIVTRVGDRIIDTSTRGKLAALRRSLVLLPG